MSFAQYLKRSIDFTDKTRRALGDSKMNFKKTFIAHPQVWKDEKEAELANTDWAAREQLQIQKETEKFLNDKLF